METDIYVEEKVTASNHCRFALSSVPASSLRYEFSKRVVLFPKSTTEKVCKYVV